MAEQATVQQSDYPSLTDRFREEYLDGYWNRAENTIRSNMKVVRHFFRFWHLEKRGISEDEFESRFMEYKYPSTHRSSDVEPRVNAEDVVAKTKREIEALLSEEKYGGVDAVECLCLERDKERPRKKVIEALERKKRAEPKIVRIIVRDEDLKQITEEDIEDYVLYMRDKQDVKQSTATGYLNNLKNFFEWAGQGRQRHHYGVFEESVDWTFLKKLIKDSWDKSKSQSDDGGQVLDLSEVRRILRAAHNPKDKAFVLLMVKTGMRRETVTRLKWADLNLDENWAWIESRKTGHRGKALFDDECAKYIRIYRDSHAYADSDDYVFNHSGGQKYQPSSIYNWVNRLATHAGVRMAKESGSSTVSPHDLRHTFSNHYRFQVGETRGGDKLFYKIQVGHTLSTSEGYMAAKDTDHVSLQQRRKDYEKAVPVYLG